MVDCAQLPLLVQLFVSVCVQRAVAVPFDRQVCAAEWVAEGKESSKEGQERHVRDRAQRFHGIACASPMDVARLACKCDICDTTEWGSEQPVRLPLVHPTHNTHIAGVCGICISGQGFVGLQQRVNCIQKGFHSWYTLDRMCLYMFSVELAWL